MKLIIFSLLVLHAHMLYSSTDNVEISTLRRLYIEAVEDHQKVDEALQMIQNSTNITTLTKAYEGAFEALKAKHVWNPYKKLSHLKISQNKLEEAIIGDPTNVEIRFLRFSIQHYLPSFLRDDKKLKDDKETIIQHIGSEENAVLGEKILQTIAQFMIDSKRYTEEENKYFKSFINI